MNKEAKQGCISNSSSVQRVCPQPAGAVWRQRVWMIKGREKMWGIAGNEAGSESPSWCRFEWICILLINTSQQRVLSRKSCDPYGLFRKITRSVVYNTLETS